MRSGNGYNDIDTFRTSRREANYAWKRTNEITRYVNEYWMTSQLTRLSIFLIYSLMLLFPILQLYWYWVSLWFGGDQWFSLAAFVLCIFKFVLIMYIPCNICSEMILLKNMIRASIIHAVSRKGKWHRPTQQFSIIFSLRN